jgi:RimJ/RimL family protein N-acetyltransferase
MLKPRLTAYGIELRPIEEADLSALLAWRNREDIRSMMKSQEVITMENHRKWFSSVVDVSAADKNDSENVLGKLNDLSAQHFSICYQSKLIGSANIISRDAPLVQAKIIEPGLYIGDEKYRGNILAFAPSLVLNDYCFAELGVALIEATVHVNNAQAIGYNKKLGYQIAEADSTWIKMTLDAEQYLDATKQIRAFLSRPKRNKTKI